MPDHPSTSPRERDPLPFSPSAPGCAYSIHVNAGQWGHCGGRPEVSGVWTSPRNRERWRAFACAAHAHQFDGLEWHDVGPLDDATHAELTDRRTRWQAALDGKGWQPPRPMEPGHPERRP